MKSEIRPQKNTLFMELENRVKQLTKQAIKCGADPELISLISTDKIITTDQWVRWKCEYGCPIYGQNLCCPPFTPNPDDVKELIKEYKHALIVGFRIESTKIGEFRKKMQRCMLKIEGKAFTLQFLKAFAFNVGACVWCDECIVKELPKDVNPKLAKTYCKHKEKARPSMEAVGIDVFGTVENAGLQLKILSDKDINEAKFFGLVLLE